MIMDFKEQINFYEFVFCRDTAESGTKGDQ